MTDNSPLDKSYSRSLEEQDSLMIALVKQIEDLSTQEKYLKDDCYKTRILMDKLGHLEEKPR